MDCDLIYICVEVLNITPEKGGITKYYKVLECAANLNSIKWMKMVKILF